MSFLPAAAESIFRSHEEFHGAEEFMMRRSMSDDDVSDDGLQMVGEKKRRLKLEQVKALEKSFELGNKLEPERKMQLARALGLQPRQIAIWFQNRRARWKTKQLEKDYDILKRQYEALKLDNDALKNQNKKLHLQLLGLKTREGSWSNGSEDSFKKLSSTTDDSSRLYLDLHQQRNKHAPIASTADHHLPPDCYANMFATIQETHEFWPWSEHQNFQ